MEFTEVTYSYRICPAYQGSKLLLFIATVALLCPLASLTGDTNVPVTVIRRLTGDIYTTFNPVETSACHDKNNLTFLVSERRCVKNQELFNACSFSISPSTERSVPRLALTFGHHHNYSTVKHIATFMSDTGNSLTNAIIVAVNNINQSVNGSVCYISSLEVYRGGKYTTEISHDGFSFNDEETFMINHNNLAYSVDEYEGELYRMNISCTTEGLPRNGCLFFKVIGTATVMNAKFNLTIQGTVDNNSEAIVTTVQSNYAMTTHVTDSLSTDNAKTVTMTNTEIHEPPLASETDSLITTSTPATTVTKIDHTNDHHGLQVGSFPFYMVIGAGSCVMIVILTTILILIIYVTFHIGSKTLILSLPCDQIHRQRQRRISNSNIEEAPSADIPGPRDADINPVENSSLGSVSPVLLQFSENFEASRDRSLPPRKCDQIPIYIFLGPKETDPPFIKSSVECKQNLAYLHLGPEESSTAAALQPKPITCKRNTAYIHLDPEETSI